MITFGDKKMETGIQTPSVDISIGIKGKYFYVTDQYLFMLMTEEGQQNQICIFDDDITDKAREFADSKVPEITEITLPRKDRMDFINKARVDYWSRLFHLFISDLLAKENTLVYMKTPKV